MRGRDGVYRVKRAGGVLAYAYSLKGFDGRRIRKSGYPTYELAVAARERARRLVQEARVRGYPLDTEMTFEAATKVFLDWSRATLRSARRDEQFMHHLLGYFRGRRLVAVRLDDVEAYRMERKRAKGRGGKPVSPAEINREVARLKALYNFSIRKGWVSSNPVKGVKAYPEYPKDRYLKQEELKRLLGVCDEALRQIVTAAVTTGLRKSDILALSWKQVDWTNALLAVVEQKTRKSRFIPISRHLRVTLTDLWTQAMARPQEFRGSHVFTNELGQPLSASGWLRYHLNKAIERAGLGGTGVTFHTLRNTAASHLAMAGVDLVTVQKVMGHRSIITTRRYVELAPEYTARAVDVLGTRLLGPVSSDIVTPSSLIGIRPASDQVSESSNVPDNSGGLAG